MFLLEKCALLDYNVSLGAPQLFVSNYAIMVSYIKAIWLPSLFTIRRFVNKVWRRYYSKASKDIHDCATLV
jgi:hypothetical protein